MSAPTAKQKRFAQEYVIDHNGAQAAIRAGYAKKQAKTQASRMLRNVAIRQMMTRLDAKKVGELSLEQSDVVRRIGEVLDIASRLQPKIRHGEPVTYVEDGEIRTVYEFLSPSVLAKMLELQVRVTGAEAQRSTVEVKEVVHTLVLDKDLSVESDE